MMPKKKALRFNRFIKRFPNEASSISTKSSDPTGLFALYAVIGIAMPSVGTAVSGARSAVTGVLLLPYGHAPQPSAFAQVVLGNLSGSFRHARYFCSGIGG